MPKRIERPEWEERWMSLAAPYPPIDLEIAQAFGKAGADYKVSKGSVTGFISGDGVGGYGNPTVPNYSGDVSAVLALIEEKAPYTAWSLAKAIQYPGDPHIGHYAYVDVLIRANAELPAVALAIAFRKYLEIRAVKDAAALRRKEARRKKAV